MASRCNVVHKDQSGAQRRTSVSAVLYARVSSKDQEREGFSIPAQLQLLRGYAASRGLTVLKEFVDVETAKQAGHGLRRDAGVPAQRQDVPHSAGRED